jgi:two-component system NtrC family sensor kinase
MVMPNKISKRIEAHPRGRKLAEDFRTLSHRILFYANRSVPRIDFIHEVSKIIMEFSGCDAAELWLKEGIKCNRFEVKRHSKQPFRFETMSCTQNENGETIPCVQSDSSLERICSDIIRGKFDPSLPFFTRRGSFWTGNTQRSLTSRPKVGGKTGVYDLKIDGNYRSLALIPLAVGNQNIGLLQLKSKQRYYLTEYEIEFYENVAKNLGVALVIQRAQADLRERIKELTCLYGIARVTEQPGISMKDILRSIVKLLPPAWQYPEITQGKIVLNGYSYTTSGFQEGQHKQVADIVVKGEKRGVVEVSYTEEKPELDEGPFLKEERSLINAIAREIALIVEQKQAEQEKFKLQEQLRHADRLATIGQLAAGVAHELNEPLGNILGFAQLTKKYNKLPKEAAQDIEKIVKASLHAREVIKKLMFFARQMPPQKIQVNLNQLVEEGLYFLESRCAKEGVKLVRSLSPDLPQITADPSQLHQVLVNLVVNAVQAMPEGGKLKIQTLATDDHVSLIVEDTGVGMSKDVIKQIFIPFFTTKDVGQGTGLGLPVVHGIVTAHGGSIKVDSEVGRGTRFEIQLPVSGSQGAEEDN